MRFFPRFARRALLVLLVTAPICACGQKGPLYLRETPPPGTKPEKPAPYKPVPYPPDEPREAK
jgi:predicted small lipoprotein YifL